jgi:hypothetical protein
MLVTFITVWFQVDVISNKDFPYMQHLNLMHVAASRAWSALRAMACCQTGFVDRPLQRQNLILCAGVLQPLSACLSVQDLARLCACRVQLHHATQDLVRTAMREQHGFVVSGCALGDLRALEDAPMRCEINCRRHEVRKVRQGSALRKIFVGSAAHLATQAQCPPACGDAWSARIELKRGQYNLELEGWLNPSHGVLSLFLDGSPLADFDWSSPRTQRCTHATQLHVRWTGVHCILARTDRSNAALSRKRRFWMCLRNICITVG